VLAIGGSDPSGAAGIQADLKTFTASGVFGAAAITSVTVQNQKGVTDSTPLPASIVLAQVDAAFLDAPFDAVKTGMLGSADIVHGIADRARQWGPGARLIVDPVLVSSSGRALLSEEGKRALLERLIPSAALVTPNIPEATALTGVPITCVDDMSVAADHLLARGAAAVLVKGGHLLELDAELQELTDLLRTADGEEVRLVRSRRRIGKSGAEFRGTGCTLASAIAAGVAEGLTLKTAVDRARDYLDATMAAGGPYLNVRGLYHAAGLLAVARG
jgi:hydroxymethylpyrimidine/phosphomethylpyrimidine kinase